MIIKRALLGFVLLVGLMVGVVGVTSSQNPVIQGANSPRAIKDSYIVVMKDDVTATPTDASRLADRIAKKVNARIKSKFTQSIDGFSAQMTEAEAKKLLKDPNVKFVEQDAVATISATQSNPPSWGLDRIDQRNLPIDKKYVYPNTASSVSAYILDTGIRVSHSDFGGRAVNGWDFIDNDSVANDCNGHGTHVAGTVGGNAYGVAKGVKLVGVRVLGCNGTGSYSAIIAGVDWVTRNAQGHRAVANMSLGGTTSAALNNAVQKSIDAGVVYAVAAGNNNGNACSKSPASAPNAITVGNSTSSDSRHSSSNYGNCLDIFAPGTSIKAASHSSDTTIKTMTGTSMASPHVAGAAALVLQANPNWTPKQVRDSLVNSATSNKITSAGSGSPNKLLFVTGSTSTPAPQPTPTPTPTPTPATCSPVSNGSNYTIPDLKTVRSPLTITGCDGKASSQTKVSVSIRHSFRGDLRIYLVAPDLSMYRLKNTSSTDSRDNVIETYTVNVSGETANGTWKLRVDDTLSGNTGYIDSWTLNVSDPVAVSCSTYTKESDFRIPDNGQNKSPIVISNCNRNASSKTKVSVDIRHPHRGDLKVYLVAPNGTRYVLKDVNPVDSSDNVIATYTLNLSSWAANGEWKLRVDDRATGNTGHIESWSITP